MTPTTYVLTALGWFVLGVVAGAQWTRMRRDVRRIAKAQAQEEEPVAAPFAVDQDPARRSRRWRRALDIFVVLLFIASAVQAYFTYGQIKDVQDCQRIYQTGFADALDARSAASTEAQNANDELWATIGQLTAGTGNAETRTKFQAALANYFDKRAEAKKKQQENPYPPSPRDLCAARS